MFKSHTNTEAKKTQTGTVMIIKQIMNIPTIISYKLKIEAIILAFFLFPYPLVIESLPES